MKKFTIQLQSITCFLLIAILIPTLSFSANNPDFNGKWKLIKEKSSHIDLLKRIDLFVEFKQDVSTITILTSWGGDYMKDTLNIKTGDNYTQIPVYDRVFPTNIFMGLSMPVGEKKQVKAVWENGGKTLKVEEKYDIIGSQGKSPMVFTHIYELSDDKELLIHTIKRSTRTTGPEIKFIYKKDGFKEGFFYKLQNDWKIDGELNKQAFLISLQGVVNMNGPKLYFIYPEDWPFPYTPSVYDFYKNERNYTFTELKSVEEALTTLKQYIKGYVVWDKSVRTSLIVSFTVAGLEQAVVVSEEMIPIMEKAGLKKIEDFRGKFTGKTDFQIYSWAYDQYWARCNKELIVWMGGEEDGIMYPGVADWGIYKKVFFNHLSAKESDTEEYNLASKILGEMKPMSLVMGWHAYSKDLERDFTSLTSRFGHAVEGIHTLPNLSFSSQIPPSPGFQYKNKHNVVPGKDYTPGKKVYITCVQTDGIGLGAWTKPGRGSIPYAWEVLMNFQWLAPSMLEYFYSQATPNDYFVGCLSGPGYVYPKAVPKELLPKLIERSYELMKKLDLNAFEIMDYSEGATVKGNTELTREVAEAYFKGMPDIIGLINGYAPAYTFGLIDGKPIISFDYYLSPTRPVDEAVADLVELAAINKNRPYFLLLHVRESSDIVRVKSILDKLGPEFEVVPLDIFLTMAAKNPTFKEKFLDKGSKKEDRSGKGKNLD